MVMRTLGVLKFSLHWRAEKFDFRTFAVAQVYYCRLSGPPPIECVALRRVIALVKRSLEACPRLPRLQCTTTPSHNALVRFELVLFARWLVLFDGSLVCSLIRSFVAQEQR